MSGDPLSPLLFLIVMKALNALIGKASELNLLKGITVGKGTNAVQVSHFFFVDDSLIFCQPEAKNLLHLRCVLVCFQLVFGLKVNLRKTEMVRFGDTSDENYLAGIMGCKAAELPIIYLSIPLDSKCKDSSTWELIIETFESRLAGWKRKFLSKGGRLTLLKCTLTNLPIYYLSTLTIPVKVAKRLESIQCRFLWGDDMDKRRFHLVNWDEVKKPASSGGLGIKSLVQMNAALQ